MNFLKQVLYLMLVTIIFFSCKKEYSYEATHGTLRDSIGSYLPGTVYGRYEAGSMLSSPNYILLTVNVLKTGGGICNIKSDTVNGYFFAASVVFTHTGLNEVKLSGAGKPIRNAVNVFLIKFDTSYCALNVFVTGIPSPGVFSFELDGQPQFYHLNPRAEYLFSATNYVLNLSGSTNNASLLFIIGNVDSIKTGTYNSSPGNSLQCKAILAINSSTTLTSVWMGGIGLSGSVIITISRVSHTRVSGNFIGILKDNNGTGANSKIISNGLFDLPIW